MLLFRKASCTYLMDHKYVLIILFSSSALSKYVSGYTCADTLLALLRVTTSLPLKLFSPRRTLLKLGSLYQVKRGSVPMQHELLLFSYGSPVLNLILGIGIGVGVVAIAESVKTRLALRYRPLKDDR